MLQLRFFITGLNRKGCGRKASGVKLPGVAWVGVLSLSSAAGLLVVIQ